MHRLIHQIHQTFIHEYIYFLDISIYFIFILRVYKIDNPVLSMNNHLPFVGLNMYHLLLAYNHQPPF